MRSLLTLVAATAAVAAPAPPRSSLYTPEGAKDGWIVVLKNDAPDGAFLHTRNIAAAAGSVPLDTFDFGPGLLRGHVMAGPGSEIAVQRMADSPYVDFIQPDSKISFDSPEDDEGLGEEENDPYEQTQSSKGLERGGHVTTPTESWGLHRLSHGPLKPGEKLEYQRNATGHNSWVYIMDTGIELGHPQFGGRAKWGAAFLKKPRRRYVIDGKLHPNETGMPRGGDDHGHGTHCAGVVGGKSVGVAQEANLVAVKILDKYGSGHASNILRGVEWVIKDATENNRLEKSVLSMSLGAMRPRRLRERGKPDASMLACRIAAEKGIFMVAAAGNERQPVDRISPAAEPQVCAVGAIDENDAHARFTNYGTGVDLMAPGVNILSAFPGNRTVKLNGTSMAAPFVAGLGAYFIELDGPGKSHPGYQMCERLKTVASYRKGVEEMKIPSNYTDTYSKYTKVASNGWGL